MKNRIPRKWKKAAKKGGLHIHNIAGIVFTTTDYQNFTIIKGN